MHVVIELVAAWALLSSAGADVPAGEETCGVKRFILEKPSGMSLRVDSRERFELASCARVPAPRIPESMKPFLEELSGDSRCTRDAEVLVFDADDFQSERPNRDNVPEEYRVPMMRGSCWLRGRFSEGGTWQKDYTVVELNEPRTFGSLTLPAGTTAHVYDSGQLRSAWLREDLATPEGIYKRRQVIEFNRKGERLSWPEVMTINGLKVSGAPAPTYYPNGKLATASLHENAKIQGIEFREYVSFFADGKLRSGIVEETVRRGRVAIAPGSHVFFDSQGKVRHYTDRAERGEVIQAISFPTRTPLTYYGDGKLRSLQVVQPTRVEGTAYPIGEVVFLEPSGKLRGVLTRVLPGEVSGIRFGQVTAAFFSKDRKLRVFFTTGPMEIGDQTYPRGTMIKVDAQGKVLSADPCNDTIHCLD